MATYRALLEIQVEGKVPPGKKGLDRLRDKLHEMVMLDLDTEGVDQDEGFKIEALAIDWDMLEKIHD